MTGGLQLTPGMVVGGDFRVERILDAGGMGAVYLSQQLSTGKTRALKVMHPQLVADERLRERFEQEARVGALIHSRHVVEVIAAGIDAGSQAPWIAMELLEGQNLGEYAADHGCLTPDELSDVLRQVCHALGAAHRVGVVHRDIKPENIFICRGQAATSGLSVKVLDFGIAKVAAQAKTTATAAVGSPAWMAPEQTDPKATIAPHTDVWALGLMAFWLLTGRAFWIAANDSHASMHALMREILFGEIPSAGERAVELDVASRILDGFDDWFARCVHRDVRRRFENADELLEAFERMLTEPTPRAVVHTSIPPASRSPRSFAHGATEPLGHALRPEEAPASSRPNTVEASSAVGATVDDLDGVPAETQPMGPRQIVSPTASPLVSEAGPPTLRAPSLRSPRAALWRNVSVTLAGALVAGAIVWSTARARPSRDATTQAVWPTITAPSATITPPTASLRTTLPAPSVAASVSATPSVVPAQRLPAAPKRPKLAPFPLAKVQSRMTQSARAAAVICRDREGPKSFAVMITWLPSGKIKNVVAGSGRGTMASTEMCARALFHSIRVDPYDGVAVTLTQAVSL